MAIITRVSTSLTKARVMEHPDPLGTALRGCEEEKVLETRQGLEGVNSPKERMETNFYNKIKTDKPEYQEEGDLNTNYLELDETDGEAPRPCVCPFLLLVQFN